MPAKLDLLVVPGPTVSPASAPAACHILAACLRGDAAGPLPEVSSLVGTGLLIRDAETGVTQLTVAPQYLAIRSVDLRDDVLMTPLQFVLVDNLPEIGAEPAAAPLTLTGTTISVTLNVAAPAGGATVWVYIEGGQQPIVHRIEVPASSTVPANPEPLMLSPGTYRALVLAPEHRPIVVETTIV